MPERPTHSRFLPQPKSVRAKTVALLAVPVISLMALWSLATVSAVQNAWTLHQAGQLNEKLAGPVRNLIDRLQDERAAAVQNLATPAGLPGGQSVSAQQARTDEAATWLRDGVVVARADIANLAPEANERLNTLTRDLDALRQDRAQITAKQLDWNSAFRVYSTAIDDAFAVDDVLMGVREGEAAETAEIVLQHGRVGEMIARQDAVASSVLLSGQMTPEQHQAFAAALGGQQVLTESLRPALPPAEQAAYQGMLADPGYRSVNAMQNQLLTGSAGAVTLDQWRSGVRLLTQAVETSQGGMQAVSEAQAGSEYRSVMTQAALTVALGLIAVLLALVVSVRIGRGMVIELVALKDSAMELANRRLPQAMRRIRAGEKIDIDADVPVVAEAEGEIGQVGEALNAVQRSALHAAAERADLLTGVSGVFVNLARRSQALVHRQLGILDDLERRTEDPAELEDLFRIDHLATRMRRHAEGLIIMSGSSPGRAWRQPVPLMDVVRSAVSEVEDYARVEIRRMPDLSVLGSSVSDVTHLFAELVENATSFSPPDSTVVVHGEAVGSGFAVEIEDRGLGMSPDRLEVANRLISEAHRLELFESDRLGLYLVSRLANRQGITVSLRRSPYGGTSAVVLLPTSMLANPEPEATQPYAAEVLREQEERVAPAVKKAVATRLPVREKAVAETPEPMWQEPEAIGPATPRSVRRVESVEEGVAEEEEPEGLPRRTRQANLAPGLKAEPLGKEPVSAAPVSPDQARSMMSALQQGFTRGRGESAEDA